MLLRRNITSRWMITDHSALLSEEVFKFWCLQCNFCASKFRNFWDSFSEHSLQIWNSTGIWMKTAIHNWCHMKLSAFWNLSALFNCNKQSRIILTHVHICSDTRVRSYSHACTHMYVHLCITVAHTHSCAHSHSCKLTRIYALTSEYKFMHMRTQSYVRVYMHSLLHTYIYIRSDKHAHLLMHKHLLCTLVHMQLSIHTRECTFVDTHSWTGLSMYTHACTWVHAHSSTRICACILMLTHLPNIGYILRKILYSCCSQITLCLYFFILHKM